MGTDWDLRWWDIPFWIPRWQLTVAGARGCALTEVAVSTLAFAITIVITSGLGTGSSLGATTGLETALATAGVLGLAWGPSLRRNRAPRSFAHRWPNGVNSVRIIIAVAEIFLLVGVLTGASMVPDGRGGLVPLGLVKSQPDGPSLP